MDTFIINSELEFRNYILKYKDYIKKIIIFEDSLDNIVYFYLFTNNTILATKEKNSIIEDYIKIYINLKDDLNFKTCINNQKKVLKLFK